MSQGQLPTISAHEFDAACGAVWGMRMHQDEFTEGDIVRTVIRELFYEDLKVEDGLPEVVA